MINLLSIKLIRFHNGERFPVIIDEHGLPQYYPNTFITADLRNKHKQCNTMINAGKSIQVLRAWEIIESIDIVKRLLDCCFLKYYEMDSLCDALWSKYEDLINRSSKIKNLNKYRLGKKINRAINVKPGTVVVRLVYIIKYIKYICEISIESEPDILKRLALRNELKTMIDMFTARIPEVSSKYIDDTDYQRLGLTYEVEGLIHDSISLNSLNNPWSLRVRNRNNIILRVLINLGIRAGELLNIRIDDVQFKNNKIYIRRLPDNPDDPRLYEPNVKTLPRRLTMTDSLAADIHDYIINERRLLPAVRTHDFLFVSSKTGLPQSRTALTNIFISIRNKIPGVPLDFGPHICRHTWNDRFTDYCDAKKIPEEKEKKMRCKIMGWVPGSQMAIVYTRRTTQEATDDFMLESQKYLINHSLSELYNDY